MIDLQFDMSDFRRAARAMKAAEDQVPYALSLAMNEAVKATRKHEVEEVWPSAVTVRNRGFIRQALRMEFASKRNLRVSIYDNLKRGNLKLHDKGGTKVARGRLAIPSKNVKRGARGVPPGQRPAALAGAFRQGNAIFQRLPNGKKRLMYTLKPSARVKADVPFTAEFVRKMREEMRRAYGPAMLKAMRSRR